MQLILDPNNVRACMTLWRETLALPGHARGEAQQVLLSRVTETLIGWSDLLRMCRAADGDEAALHQLALDISRFKGWIDDAILATRLSGELEQLNGQPAFSQPLRETRLSSRR
jgi:hypothetical protein